MGLASPLLKTEATYIVEKRKAKLLDKCCVHGEHSHNKSNSVLSFSSLPLTQ